VHNIRTLADCANAIAKPAASHDLELDLPPYRIRLRAGVSQNDFNAGFSVGSAFEILIVSIFNFGLNVFYHKMHFFSHLKS